VSRLVKILGEHLIRDNTVGLMELIKNGYDADAENVRVELKNLANPEKTEVIIEDDGVGMDENIITGPWAEPATGDKQSQKDREKPTKKGRIPLGEKGVGRFAAEKLGRYLDLVTRPVKSDVEYHVELDWDKFDSNNAYLDELEFPLHKRKPEVFTDSKHGTRISILQARDPWKKSDVERLQGSLIRLLSPSTRIKDFYVDFKCDEYPEYSKLDPGVVLQKFQFKIDCRISEKGVAKYTYWHRQPDGKVEEYSDDKNNLWARSAKNWQRFDPMCGPIRVVIHAWLRSVENLSDYGISRNQISALCGMSIYRDGFRVLPYGDPGDDWLGLDLRRTQEPGEKYGNNQIIGQVEISQEKNKGLIDKTNREGLQENQAFFDMRDLVLGSMVLLETESQDERSKAKKQVESTKTLKKEVTKLKEELEKVKSEYPQKEVRTPQGSIDSPDALKSTSATRKIVEVPVEKVEELQKQAEVIDSSFSDFIREFGNLREDRQEQFLHLIGIGLAAERFTHEFDRLVNAMERNLEAVEKTNSHNINIKALRQLQDQLKNEVALLGVARYVRKPEKNRSTKISEVIKLTIAAHEEEIQDGNIKVDFSGMEDFTVSISAASLSQVVDNIISNAIFWLNSNSEVEDRKLSVKLDRAEREIVISNNGPPIANAIKQSLFERPFITSKPDGRGLGMYISSEIMKKNGGSLKFLSENDKQNKYGAASFIIAFE
jgi:signal transduction histidine kinase